MLPLRSATANGAAFVESTGYANTLISSTEKVGAFAIGFIVGNNLWHARRGIFQLTASQVWKLAGYSIMTYSAVNAIKCVTEGPESFLTSSLTDGLLGFTGFMSGSIAYCIARCK